MHTFSTQSTSPNWADIRIQLEKTTEDTIGGVSKEALIKTVDVLENKWSKIASLKLHQWGVLHLRPKEDPYWKELPFTIEIEDNDIFVLGKKIIDNESTFKKVCLAAHLNNLKPVVHATIRYENTLGASAKWVEEATLREIGLHRLLHGKTEFVHVYHTSEYKAKYKPKKSPHIVKKMGITMEYCNAGDLFGIRRELLGHNIHNLLNVVKDMCRILDRLSNEGIIHRDIKSENLFLMELDGELQMKLGDFGFANDIKTEIARLMKNNEMVSGSSYYLSPEILYGSEVKDSVQDNEREFIVNLMCSHKSDIWSMGIVLFTMIIGEIPDFAGLAKLSSDEEANARWQRMIDLVLKDRLAPENTLNVLKDHDQIREFLFQMIRQMLVLKQDQRLSGPDLWKQFQAFEPIPK